MPINFDVNCVMQQGEPIPFLVDISSSVQEVAQKPKILHLHGMMGSIHFNHQET
ncbi:hypothetical protein [Streptomyces spiramenti]|uniref:hypothetical protein n=1 Tax=Streptomyces spiramenti TaxID=2720606 RepID=UPI00143BC72C|nr:hypothetical protein [Streptomyces spiramenti]